MAAVFCTWPVVGGQGHGGYGWTVAAVPPGLVAAAVMGDEEGESAEEM